MKSRGIIPTLLRASFLVVLIFTLLYLYFNVTSIYKQDTERWGQIIGGYLLAFSLVLIAGILVTPKVMKNLANTNWTKAFLFKFVSSAAITTILLLILNFVIKGTGTLNPIESIGYLPLLTILVHALVIAQVEEIMFAGVIFNSVEKTGSRWSAYIITAVLFALFHLAKTGGNFAIMATFIPLRFAWDYLNHKGWPVLGRRFPKIFGVTPYSVQSSAGSHFAWNMFVLGILGG